MPYTLTCNLCNRGFFQHSYWLITFWTWKYLIPESKVKSCCPYSEIFQHNSITISTLCKSILCLIKFFFWWRLHLYSYWMNRTIKSDLLQQHIQYPCSLSFTELSIPSFFHWLTTWLKSHLFLLFCSSLSWLILFLH